MIALVHYEWDKLFRGRSLSVHLILYLFTFMALVFFSKVYLDEKVLILGRSLHAKTFLATANDLIYLSGMVYGVWLSARLFIAPANDILTVQLASRLRLTLAKWGLGAFIMIAYALAGWGLTLALLNLLPSLEGSLLEIRTLAMGIVHALQAFTLFSVLARFFKTSHTFLFVLAALFFIDMFRSGLYRPEALNYGQYLSHVIMPSFIQSSGGNLVMMVSPWLVFLINGLFLVMVIIFGLTKEY
ncbi:MAG: hypothetical protein ACOC2X_00830 [Bacillota bacterium]